jgi:hypothetical protein
LIIFIAFLFIYEYLKYPCCRNNQPVGSNSKKGNVGASVIKSKYGGSTVYASTRSRSNLISSASKRGGAGDKIVNTKPPVTVSLLNYVSLHNAHPNIKCFYIR